MSVDLAKYRDYYPMLGRLINGRPLIYLDSAATALKPAIIADALLKFYFDHDSNVFRGMHVPSAQATELYERARQTVAHFLGTTANNIVFTVNSTDGAYKLANTLKIKKALLAIDLHHSSMLPFTRYKYTFLKIHPTGAIDLDDLRAKVKDHDVVVVNHVSNVTGYIQNLELIGDIVHKYNKILIVDGAQSVPHIPINVEKLPIDALYFSGHKLGGPYGSGAMYVAPRIQPDLKIGGGESIYHVRLQGERVRVEYADFPHCMEPGTPSIANQVAMAEVMKFLPDRKLILEHERELILMFLDFFNQREIKYLGGGERSGLISVQLDLSYAYKLGSLGICVRHGFHCAEPLHEFLKSPPTLRFSLYLYNTKEEVENVLRLLDKLLKGEKPNAYIIKHPSPSVTPSPIIVPACETCPLNGRCFSGIASLPKSIQVCPLIPPFIKRKYEQNLVKIAETYRRSGGETGGEAPKVKKEEA